MMEDNSNSNEKLTGPFLLAKRLSERRKSRPVEATVSYSTHCVSSWTVLKWLFQGILGSVAVAAIFAPAYSFWGSLILGDKVMSTHLPEMTQLVLAIALLFTLDQVWNRYSKVQGSLDITYSWRVSEADGAQTDRDNVDSSVSDPYSGTSLEKEED